MSLYSFTDPGEFVSHMEHGLVLKPSLVWDTDMTLGKSLLPYSFNTKQLIKLDSFPFIVRRQMTN